MQTCVTFGCPAPATPQGRCLGHLDDAGFDAAVARLKDQGGDVDATEATITGERVSSLVSQLAGSEREFDFSEARVDGDVRLAGVHLLGPVRFSGTEVQGTLRMRNVIGLEHVVLGEDLGPFGQRRTSLWSLEVIDCAAPSWTVRAADVCDVTTVRGLETGLLELDGVALGKEVVMQDVHVKGGLRIYDATWGSLQIDYCKSSGDVIIAASEMESLRLRQCELSSRVEVHVDGLLELVRCTLEASLDIHWNPRTPPRRFARTGRLTLEATRIASNAHLRWGGHEIALVGTVFSAASALERHPEASIPPALVNVRRLDGEKLRIGQVDLHECKLAEAASLGAIESEQLRLGLGAAGITRRRYIADEGPRSSLWALRDAEVRAARRRGAPELARTYRDLRTSCEAVGDYAGANDLHYGERLWHRKASRMFSVQWLWLWIYGLFGYGVRPWRPLAALLLCVVASTVAFGLAKGLERQRTVRGASTDRIADLCGRGAPDSPAERQLVFCRASAQERLEFSLRATTAIIRPIGGYEVRGAATAIDIALRLLAALFFGLFVLAIRNRVRR